MTRVIFGVSASSFAANMAVKQNTTEFTATFPRAADVVERSFYVDDCLTGADSIPRAISLRSQLHSLFLKAGFVLRKWNSSKKEVLKVIHSHFKEASAVQSLPSADEYAKTLGIEWKTDLDHFFVTIAKLPPLTTSPNARWSLISSRRLTLWASFLML